MNSNPIQYDDGTLYSQYIAPLPKSDYATHVFIHETNSGTSGRAYGENIVTTANAWSDYHLKAKPPGALTEDPWHLGAHGRLILHEVFHNNGLWKHPFQIDDCDDTPTLNPPCWDWSADPNDPCNTAASNNLLDYNATLDWSLSPCQISRLNDGLKSLFLQNFQRNRTLRFSI